MSQPAYPGARPAAEIASRLGEACAHEAHAFWPDSVDLLGTAAVSWPHVLGHRQVTDTYLLALAVKNRGRLVSFDRRIAPGAVAGARAEHLVVIQS
jgi:uncharacterized protein